MEKNLLLKEEEFHKLNAELELKTQELLREVENVMKIQDQNSNTANATHQDQNSNTANATHQDPNESFSSSCAEIQNVITVSLNDVKQKMNNTSRPALRYTRSSSARHCRVARCQDDILPKSSLGMGLEGLVRFLKAKLRELQNEMQALQTDYKKKTDKWHKLQTEMKCIEEERNKWQHQAMTFRDTMRKLEEQNSIIATKLSQQESENSSLKKELETLKKELSLALQTSSGNEVRLNRSLEELEKLRTLLNTYKRDDKELRNLVCRKGDEAAAVVKRLEKQKTELLHGFKKQMQLIDNLKKQKTHLKAACLIQFTEAEFLKLLDWCPTAKT